MYLYSPELSSLVKQLSGRVPALRSVTDDHPADAPASQAAPGAHPPATPASPAATSTTQRRRRTRACAATSRSRVPGRRGRLEAQGSSGNETGRARDPVTGQPVRPSAPSCPRWSVEPGCPESTDRRAIMPGAGRSAGYQQRMPAQVKEAVINPHPGNTQHPREQVAQPLLLHRPRRPPRHERRAIRSRQPARSSFPFVGPPRVSRQGPTP
jgi:hypothetical protein